MRDSRRIAATALAAIAVLLTGAGSALAHVEASAPGAQAGSGPVTVSFLAEAESTTAGIVGVQVQLPAGISPDQTSLATGPVDWTFTPTPDGYEVIGPTIGPGVDLEYTISVTQLPRDATELPFKTLLRYSDGREDPWIELPTDANPQPDNPAPTITVAPAPPAPQTTPALTTSSTPSTASAPSSTTADRPDEAADSSSGDGDGVAQPIVTAASVVAAALAGLWFWRSRRSRIR